jgi:hypothetical protein
MLEGVARRVRPGTGALVVRTTFENTDAPAIRWEGSDFLLEARDGARVRVVIDDDTVFVHRRVRGRWRTLRDHVAAPRATIDPGRRMRISGFWVCEGDLVALDEEEIDGPFVEGTGGPREVPARERCVRARFIGVGSERHADLYRARRGDVSPPPNTVLTAILRGVFEAILRP